MVAFVSTRTGQSEVWTAHGDGSNPVQVTSQGYFPTAPRWSPDSRFLALAQRPLGNVDVYVVDAQGGTPNRMTTHPAIDSTAYWSRDGRWLYFVSDRTGRNEIWKMPADGSAHEMQVTHNGGWRSRESFDRKFLYYQKLDVRGLFRTPVAGGSEELVADVEPPEDWELAPGCVYYLHHRADEYLVEKTDLAADRRTTEVLKLPPGTIGDVRNFSVSSDGHWLLFVHEDHLVSELMIIENFR